MSDESAHNRPTVPLAASLAQFTENLIARRGVEQANILFGGQIDPAIQALRVRTKSVGVGDKAPDFSMPMAEGGTWSLAEQFGLTFEMDDAAKNILKGSNIDLEKRNADGRWILPVPGTFVIDRSGHIAYAHVDADYRNRPEPQEIIAICRALQR